MHASWLHHNQTWLTSRPQGGNLHATTHKFRRTEGALLTEVIKATIKSPFQSTRLTSWVGAARSFQLCIPCLSVACLANLELLILLLFELRLITEHVDCFRSECAAGDSSARRLTAAVDLQQSKDGKAANKGRN